MHQPSQTDLASLTSGTALAAEFALALEAGDQLRLAYQPRLDLASGRVTGMEALIRWRHPTLGTMNPYGFFEAIEDEASMRALTAWVLDAATRQARVWELEGRGLTVSVNVEMVDMLSGDLAARVGAALESSGLPPHLLAVDVPSDVIGTWNHRGIDAVGAVRALGVQIALDGFGLGNGVLALLAHLPFGTIRIDKHFVRGLDVRNDEASGRVVAASVAMAKAMGMRCAAVGVETQKQLDALRAMGVDEVQGYLIARPASADGAVEAAAPVTMPVAA